MINCDIFFPNCIQFVFYDMFMMMIMTTSYDEINNVDNDDYLVSNADLVYDYHSGNNNHI